MKLLKTIMLLFAAVLFVQCDTAERRKSKAEELIKKQLFETLDNYQSCELISVELDSIDVFQEAWMTNPEFFEIGKELASLYEARNQIDGEISELTSRKNRLANEASNSFLFRRSAGFWNYVNSASQCQNRIEELSKTRDDLNTHVTVLSDSIGNMFKPMDRDKFYGWHGSCRLRYADSGNETRIHTHHYIFDPKVGKIYLSWDEEDAQSVRVVNAVTDAIIYSLGEEPFLNAVTEDEVD